MDSQLCNRAIEEGMLFVPGQFCFPPDPQRPAPTHAIRLCFGVARIDQIQDGIARLAKAYRSCGYAGATSGQDFSATGSQGPSGPGRSV
jgi:DNA-binding transcriptional MocR family regulator